MQPYAQHPLAVSRSLGISETVRRLVHRLRTVCAILCAGHCGATLRALIGLLSIGDVSYACSTHLLRSPRPLARAQSSGSPCHAPSVAVGACQRVTAVVYVCGVKTFLTKPLRWLIVLHHKRVPQLIGAAQRAREAGETRESEQSLPNWVCNKPVATSSSSSDTCDMATSVGRPRRVATSLLTSIV